MLAAGGAFAAIFGTIILIAQVILAFGGDDGGSATPGPSVSPKTTAERMDEAIFRLRDSDERFRLTGVSKLRNMLGEAGTSNEERGNIVDVLVTFIREQSPASPRGQTLDYCATPPAEPFPSEVTYALQAIGETRGQKSDSIDLTGVNLSHTSLGGLDLRNVRFDDSLICQSGFAGSQLQGATFRQTNLRFSSFESAVGLDATQLLASSSLFGVELPAALSKDRLLVEALAVDPECPLRTQACVLD